VSNFTVSIGGKSGDKILGGKSGDKIFGGKRDEVHFWVGKEMRYTFLPIFL
jgi:hypothetical protein